MKIAAFGDTHGRTNWINHVYKNDFDKIVFIGDYFDSHDDITAEYQKLNFEDLISFNEKNMDKVVLLLGNHDYHYLKPVKEKYRGFQGWQETEIQELLHSALDKDLMQMCFSIDKFLFTHSGVTKTWLASTGYSGEAPLDLFLNDLFKQKPLSFGFNMGDNQSTYGDDITQSPIWVRSKSLLSDMIDDYVQVVGHTPQDQLTVIDNKLALIDSLGTSGEYLVIENGVMSASPVR